MLFPATIFAGTEMHEKQTIYQKYRYHFKQKINKNHWSQVWLPLLTSGLETKKAPFLQLPMSSRGTIREINMCQNWLLASSVLSHRAIKQNIPVVRRTKSINVGQRKRARVDKSLQVMDNWWEFTDIL